MRAVGAIDLDPISELRPEALHGPAENAGLRRPDLVLQRGGREHLRAVVRVEEEQLICATIRLDIRRVVGEVKMRDVSRRLQESAVWEGNWDR